MNSTIDLCVVPAGVSPNGIYNFVNPPILGTTVIVVSVVLGVISTAFTVGRLFVNRNKLRSADYFTFIGCLSNIAYMGVIYAQHRFYRHLWDIPVCWYTVLDLWLPFVQTIIYCPTFVFTKAAIFLLYRQLFAIGKGFQIAIDIGLVITFLLYLPQIPLAAIYTAPRPGQSWDSLLRSSEAHTRQFIIGGCVVQGAVGAVLDFYIFFLPLPTLFRLHILSRQRWQLIGVFSTALFGVGAGVASLVFKVKLLSSTDTTWWSAEASLSSLIETNVAIIVGCMPTVAQLVRVHIGGSAFFKSLRSWLLGSSSDSASSKVISDEHGPTFGSNQTPRRNNYYELTDSLLLETQATIQATARGDAIETDGPSKPEAAHSGPKQFV